MGSSYQTILAAGGRADIEAAVAAWHQDAAIVPVAESRWAVVPVQEDGVYAETEGLAQQLSLVPGGVAASFSVFGSDVLVAMLFRDGGAVHEYLSDQAYLVEGWDDDDNEILFDLLARPYLPGATPPSGPFGADPAAFLGLGVAPVDQTALGAALTRTEDGAVEQHHAILHALNVDPRPLTMTFAEIGESDLLG
ncbi:hypothetical protein [Paractinoplanes maris]|uniref:hypothetical protein n=1 Tax=Paractinoplanes maris TaxID=1734446 RepID=UPI0020218D44|nr:hypothetical protein [Actinoplanes maris]